MEWYGESEWKMNNIHFHNFPPLGCKSTTKVVKPIRQATFPQFQRLLLERLYVLVACQDRITLNFSHKGYNFRIPRDQTVYFLTFLLFVEKSGQNSHKTYDFRTS